MTLNEFLQAMDSRGSGASEKSIALFEKELGGKLPADYRDFLLKSNGGSCGGGGFCVIDTQGACSFNQTAGFFGA